MTNRNSKTYQKYGIELDSKCVFGKQNLIIGKNGSGKTRFLKAILENAEAQKDVNVISLFFPEVRPFFNMISSDVDNVDDEIEFFDILMGNQSLNFGDFLKLAESNKGRFLQDLLKLSLTGSKYLKNLSKIALENLNHFIDEFLNRSITIDDNNDIIVQSKGVQGSQIRALKITDCLTEFSPGELMLFYISIFIFFIEMKVNTRGGTTVVIIDEPETHLHPRVLLNFINHMRKSSVINELWIATHSLFLLPTFEFEDVYIMENSKVQVKNSDSYRRIFDEIVGLENIDVFEFLKSIDSWQYYKFILECFSRPKSIKGFNLNDQQTDNIISMLEKRDKKEIRLLDYGAGKYRLWRCLNYLDDKSNQKNILYYAYEPYPEDEVPLGIELYTKISDIPNNSKFDVIVLMNVLHEINILDWESTFQHITQLLDESGILFLIEVSTLTNGELPYGDSGFLVLDDLEVKLLFKASRDANIRKNGEKSNCWILQKTEVENVNKSSILDALSSLKESSINKLREVYLDRNKNLDTLDEKIKRLVARKYAFLTQQYINAMFAYELYLSNRGELTQIYPSSNHKNMYDSNHDSSHERFKFPGLK